MATSSRLFGRGAGRLILTPVPRGGGLSAPNGPTMALSIPPPLAPPPTPVLSRSTATTATSGAILDEPRREHKFGLVKVFLTVITGLSIGAWVSQKMAAFLEENELFVPDDDDDDDD